MKLPRGDPKEVTPIPPDTLPRYILMVKSAVSAGVTQKAKIKSYNEQY